MATGGKLDRTTSSRKGGSTLQKIAQKKEQLKLYPRIKKVERIATHLHCEVGFNQSQHTDDVLKLILKPRPYGKTTPRFNVNLGVGTRLQI